LTAFVHNFTQTPDISFESVKGLGQFSGIALKMLFIDAHMKAADKEDLFGQGVQRRINLLTAMLKYIDSSIDTTVNIEPEFSYFMPRDLMEEIRILKEATDSGLMSKETAIKQNPLLMDGDSEIERIQAEVAEAVNVPPLNTNLSDQ
jgi:SPP1 family phage portal protein